MKLHPILTVTAWFLLVNDLQIVAGGNCFDGFWCRKGLNKVCCPEGTVCDTAGRPDCHTARMLDGFLDAVWLFQEDEDHEEVVDQDEYPIEYEELLNRDECQTADYKLFGHVMMPTGHFVFVAGSPNLGDCPHVGFQGAEKKINMVEVFNMEDDMDDERADVWKLLVDAMDGKGGNDDELFFVGNYRLKELSTALDMSESAYTNGKGGYNFWENNCGTFALNFLRQLDFELNEDALAFAARRLALTNIPTLMIEAGRNLVEVSSDPNNVYDMTRALVDDYVTNKWSFFL